MYVFGDSYSDSGAGYVDGNGPTAVVYLAEKLGIPFTYYGDTKTQNEHPIREGLNFAISGAQSGGGLGSRGPHDELLGRGMRVQVEQFATLVRKGDVVFDPQRTMFFLLGGLNDRQLPQGMTKENIEGEISTLYAVGARRFLIGVLPEKIPSFAAAATRANPELNTIPAEMQKELPDISIEMTPWGPMFDRVITDGAKYGFTNTIDKCAGRALRNEDTTPCAAPEKYFFYHENHPSTAAHKVVGDLMYREAMGQEIP